ncbi:MAG: hypothetical protein IV100_06000 [Myxococcales bacterium]|nr:hypothetical protein [Myxococcales bacterium]
MITPILALLLQSAPAGVIDSVDLPASFTAGTPVTVTVHVQNAGDGDELLVESASAPEGWSVSPGSVPLTVAAGQSGTATFTITPAQGIGDLSFELFYDDLGPWNTSLDTWTSPVSAVDGLPNLVVQSILLDPSPPSVGHAVTVTANLRNEGPGTVASWLCLGGDIPVHYLVDGVKVADETLACGLDPDESDPEATTIIFRSPGAHLLSVIVDPDGAWAETTEADNRLDVNVDVAYPDLAVVPTLPAVGAPGERAVPVALTVENRTSAQIEDVWVELRFDDGPAIDLGWAQDADLSDGEAAPFTGKVDFGSTSNDLAFAPGDHRWRYRLWAIGLPGEHPDAFPLSDERTLDIELVDTVMITEDAVVIPIVEPVVAPTGPVSSWTVAAVQLAGGTFDVTLGFDTPLDPTADGSALVLPALANADVYDEAGEPVCDAQLRRDVLVPLLVWRDLLVEYPWYRSTYVALQEGFSWYQNENHLQVAYWITQPFVALTELMDDLLGAGKDLVKWLGGQVGFDNAAEEAVGEETFKAVTRITKGHEALDEATRALMKLSPLLSGEPYLSDHVVTERLVQAIEADGAALDQATVLIHDIIASTSPKAYTSIKEILKAELILKAVKKTLVKGVKTVLFTAVKRGFTAYFVAQLTAKTALQVAIGEGSAALLAGLGAASIAKGIASLGVTLLIDASIAYLGYTGTYINNIRGKGGLCESGRIIAQSIPWHFPTYVPTGAAGPLDLDEVESTFLSHAAMIELYGFVNADLATLKKLAFAFEQSKSYQAEAEGLFAVASTQRDLAAAVEAAVLASASPACSESPMVDVPAPSYQVAPLTPELSPVSRYAKRAEARPTPPPPPKNPFVAPETTDPTPDDQTDGDVSADPAAGVATSGCSTGTSRGGLGVLLALWLVFALSRRFQVRFS